MPTENISWSIFILIFTVDSRYLDLAYLEAKIWSLLKQENLTTDIKILSNFSSFPQYFQYISNFRSQITYTFVKCGSSIYFFLNSANLICWGTKVHTGKAKSNSRTFQGLLKDQPHSFQGLWYLHKYVNSALSSIGSKSSEKFLVKKLVISANNVTILLKPKVLSCGVVAVSVLTCEKFTNVRGIAFSCFLCPAPCTCDRNALSPICIDVLITGQ